MKPELLWLMLAVTLPACGLSSLSRSANSDVFLMQDGNLIMEAESAEAVGDWQLAELGEKTVLLWDADGSSITQVPEGHTLTYEFETDVAGTYGISLHSARVRTAMNADERYENGEGGTERTDTGNDVFVAVIDAATRGVTLPPTKLYTVLGNADQTLIWGTNFDDNHQQSPAWVTLRENARYRLEISGRSDGYALDRITLSKEDFLINDTLPPSPLK